VRISSYMPQFYLTPPALPTLARKKISRMISCCFRKALKPSATGIIAISKLYQLSGNAIFPTAYMILCVRFICFVRRKFHPLRHRRNTRYGWLARPFPTGTFTLQDAPSFAWHSNAQRWGRRKYWRFLPVLLASLAAYC